MEAFTPDDWGEVGMEALIVLFRTLLFVTMPCCAVLCGDATRGVSSDSGDFCCSAGICYML